MSLPDFKSAVRYLRRTDSRLAEVIRRVGPCRLKPTGGRFEVLARSIVAQQISVSAARTIFRRLQQQLPSGRMSAAGISAFSDDQLQSAGLSRQKRRYLRDLTHRTLNGDLNFRRLAKLSDDQVIKELVEVKGIGEWTAQMFLLFGLGRPDVFAPGDLGIRNAIARIYETGKEVSPSELLAIASAWAPWRSVASWYLWQYLDLDATSHK